MSLAILEILLVFLVTVASDGSFAPSEQPAALRLRPGPAALHDEGGAGGVGNGQLGVTRSDKMMTRSQEAVCVFWVDG